MEISPSLMYVVLPIIGVVIGAALQYWFTKVLEERRRRQNLKTQAYVDFIRSFMDAHFKGKEEEFISNFADATARIAIYGSKEVVEAIANVKRTVLKYKKEKTPESEFRHSFTAIIQAMRKDNLPKESVSDKEISQLLFGKD